MTEETIEPEEGLERLLEPSDTLNPGLEEVFEEEEDLSQGVDIPSLQDKRCALCALDEFPYSNDESIMKRTEEYVVVEAATDNSHGTRNMIVLKDHSHYPSDEELDGYAADALEDLVKYTATSEDQMVAVYADMNTFDHPHIIASDLEPEDPEEADLESINNYVVFENESSLDEPIAEHYGDAVGEGLLKRFYQAAVR